MGDLGNAPGRHIRGGDDKIDFFSFANLIENL